MDRHGRAECGSEALRSLVSREGASVPDLFWREMRNVLLKTERRGRGLRGAAEGGLLILTRLPLTVMANRTDAIILDLARTQNLTPYDAAYLDLALSIGLPLATADKALVMAARACGVALLGPLAP